MTFPSDHELLRRAVETAVPRNSRAWKPRWVAVMDTFMLGSTYAWQLCERFGLNPDEKVRHPVTEPDLPIDSWRELPAIQANGYPGMTELRVGNRAFQIGGVGANVRKRLERFAAKKLGEVA